jgi:hypothetical protein
MNSTGGSSIRVPWMAHVYVWVFVVALGASPAIVMMFMDRGSPIPAGDWAWAIVAMIGIQVLFWYAQVRCTSEKFRYWDGLLLVAAFMFTGWVYMSALVVFPALLVTILISVFLSLYYSVVPPSGNAVLKFHKLIAFFHKHRMRQ